MGRSVDGATLPRGYWLPCGPPRGSPQVRQGATSAPPPGPPAKEEVAQILHLSHSAQLYVPEEIRL